MVFVHAWLVIALAAAAPPAGKDPTAEYRSWIQEMKGSERGPFTRIRWYCKDGSILPPTPSACMPNGGGYQHGELSPRTTALRAQGFYVANLLAGVDAPAFVADPRFPEAFGQMLVERFLIGADDGWILRRARFYRGAIQEEDERDGARQLLLAMVARPEWVGYRYPALRTGARLMAHGRDGSAIQKFRDEAATLAGLDPSFEALRAKIHGSPEPSDAARVRAYAEKCNKEDLKPRYEALAVLIEAAYQIRPLTERLDQEARSFSRAPWLGPIIREHAKGLGPAVPGPARYAAAGALLVALRDALPRLETPAERLRALDLSLAVDEEAFRISTSLRDDLAGTTRRHRVGLLAAASDVAYGAGLVNARLHEEQKAAFARLAVDEIALGSYLRELKWLGLAPGWGTQALRFHCGESVDKLAEIEPLAAPFIQDQLRGSALLFYSAVLDGLLRDATRIAGARYTVYGKELGVGLNALNPGLARGLLHGTPDMRRLEEFRYDGIYVLPESVADLPPLAGILTTGSGNPLSHVQLLARNLGIPNVAVDEAVLDDVRSRDGRMVVLAVSPAGTVELSDDGPQWAGVFAESEAQAADAMIRPDLQKLDLGLRRFVNLADLRASDSGRIVGPKAAKLGELHHSFPGRVAPGVAIPFGLFCEALLDRPFRDTGKTAAAWMTERFREVEALPPRSPQQEAASEELRATIYDYIRGTDPGPTFRQRLKEAMASVFGPDFKGGVFVRSDTNVEDLPGFTGAGLNLTLPNLVGFDNMVKAISEVWASPYTARAFAWRQGHMKDPEHVYPAVLLLQTVPSDKSGVMVTQSLETGDRSVLSVAVNEGMSGAVDGQAAESLRVDTGDASLRVLATATAPWRLAPRAEGGVARLRTSGSETLLTSAEIAQLIAFAKDLPTRFPSIVDDAGQVAAADVEFAFVGGQLQLLQIRPFLESRKAQANAYLVHMDEGLRTGRNKTVRLTEVPAP